MYKTYQPCPSTAQRVIGWQLEAVVGIPNAEWWCSGGRYFILGLLGKDTGPFCMIKGRVSQYKGKAGYRQALESQKLTLSISVSCFYLLFLASEVVFQVTEI